MTAVPLAPWSSVEWERHPARRGWRDVILRVGNPRFGVGAWPRKRVKANDADDQPADPQAAAAERLPQQGTGAAGEPAEARRLHARLHHDAEEAELGVAQGRQGTPHQRLRGDRLYPGRGS